MKNFSLRDLTCSMKSPPVVMGIGTVVLLVFGALPLVQVDAGPAAQPAALSSSTTERVASDGTQQAGSASELPAGSRARVVEALRRAPLMFIENVGQFPAPAGGTGDSSARFQVRGADITLWLADDALWFTVLERPQVDALQHRTPPTPERFNAPREDQSRQGVNLKLSFVGANPHPRLESFNRLDTHVSYFIGSDPANWHADVPVWDGVRYVNLYPGMDLEITDNGRHWAWRLVMRDNANAGAQGLAPLQDVRLRVDGADALALDGDRLGLTTAVGEFTLPLLEAVAADGSPLPASGERPGVRANIITYPFSSSPGPRASVSPQDASDLVYSTFLGGSNDDGGHAIAVDGSGAAYVTGETSSSDFPTTPGAFDTIISDSPDVFVTKLNASGSGLAYATFLGGIGGDGGYAIAMDGSGAAYITGWAGSSDFPTTPGAFDTIINGGGDVFVTKLNASGTGLVYSTFLGGSSSDSGEAIAVDGGGAAYITGWTLSSDFPTTPGTFDTTHNGGYYDAFITKLNASGSGLVYSTFLGGNSSDSGEAIAVDGGGAAYITGSVGSSDFPTTPGAFDITYNGGYYDAFITKLNASGSGLVYSTFLGGSFGEGGGAIAVDGGGAAYITGDTDSSDFPTTPNAFDTTRNGGYTDAFVAKLNASGSGLTYSTFLGGSYSDSGHAIVVDGSGAAHVTGETFSFDFPTTPSAFDTTRNGSGDVFVTKFNTAGSALLYSTYLGGNGWDHGDGITVDGAGNAYVTGHTQSTNFPTVNPYQGTYGGGYRDAFVAKLVVEGGPGPTPTPTSTSTPGPTPTPTPTTTPGPTPPTPTPPSGLIYTGPLYLPADTVMVSEADRRITMGDHVHLRLPFRNIGPQSLSNVTVEMLGGQWTGSSPGVSIHNGTTWANQQIVSLMPTVIGPGETGIADSWIYVTNPDPVNRRSLNGQTWLQVRTDAGQWTIHIALSPISFTISGNETLKSGSCLHNPRNFEIQKYAQYAAAAWTMSPSPTNTVDPDIPEQAVRNLVKRVNQEFHPNGSTEGRVPDTTLITRRHERIGVCRHYADLTVGLMRALNLPARYITAMFRTCSWQQLFVGHAWTEVYLPTESGWQQADSTWNQAFNKKYYEEDLGCTVMRVWADRFPLSSACYLWIPQCRCVPSCYQPPIDCPDCRYWSVFSPRPWDMSCVEDVRSQYHDVAASAAWIESAEDGQIIVRPRASVFVTRTVPFTLDAGLVNSTTVSLSTITATVSISESVDSTVTLFSVDPPYQVVSDVAPGETVTVTWVVTPLVTGSGIPLRVAAEGDGFFGFAEQPLMVNEPGTLPDLNLNGICGLDTILPGQTITLTASVLDERLQPITDTATLVTAAISSTTGSFSTSVSLPYCAVCDAFQQAVNIPTTAPIGAYRVDFTASRPGYESAQSTAYFFVASPLSVTLTTNRDTLNQGDVLTLTVGVLDRSTMVSEANVLAEIQTPGGVVTIPVPYGTDGNYVASLRPVDLAPNLNGRVVPGTWQILAEADYNGGTGTAQKAVTVRASIYLPILLKSYSGG